MTFLTEIDFNTCLKHFIEVSNSINDTWELVTFEEQVRHTERKQYLVKKNVPRLLERSQKNITNDTVFQCEEDLETVKDDVFVAKSSDSIPCTFEYNIVYSHSYAVPVLYFNACKADGQLLSLDEVWEMIPKHYQTRLQHEQWTFITQQEHPIIGRPFFTLHPCHTADLMKSVFAHNKQTGSYLVSWLSSVGPVVGLDLPLAFAALCGE
ncbi:ubiquitin-like-conjugating enzyme ATG10 [Antedon mediterranea]|uniref:ubiquitin-like-conjugating enzyme ATG10 n=1 Tax=Antedon mediterranea TaxID=105859 RepID=UPI003AF917FD